MREAIIISCIAWVLFGMGVLIGYEIKQEPVKADLPVCKPLSYDAQHLSCIRFMVDNPHVMERVCEHDFVNKLPMDGRLSK